MLIDFSATYVSSKKIIRKYNMLGSFFSAIGGSIGKYIGGGILSSIGRYAGKYIGDFLERKWFHKKEVFQKYASLKESFTLSTATLGLKEQLQVGSGCGSVGKFVAPITRGPRFKSRHWQSFY